MAMDVPKMKQLSDLPFNLVTDILFRLPIETLLSCRYVCKAWDGFFTNPEFAEMQLAASPIHFLERLVLKDRAIHFGRVVKVDGKLQAQTVDFTPRHLPVDTYWCVNSYNGLLCLVGRDDGSISVCNPLLGHSVSIPDPVNHRSGHKSVAIGFSANDGLYKVLVAYQLEENNYRFEIYTLGTREWRAVDSIEVCKSWHTNGEEEEDEEKVEEEEEEEEEDEESDDDYGFSLFDPCTRKRRVIDTVEGCTPWPNNGMDFNTFVHGSLHWIGVGVSTAGTRVRCLWAFNFETEKFQRLALPEEGDDCRTTDYTEVTGKDEDLRVQIGVMNGRLWICFCDADDSDIWVMKEYGVKESWTQILGFRSYISQSEVLCPIRFLKYGYPGDGVAYPVLLYSFSHKDVLITDEEDPGKSHSVHVEKVLVADSSGQLVCYNTKKRKERVVEFNKSRSSHTYNFRRVTSYVPSFVSLQDVAKGEEVKVSRITYEAAQ